MIPKQFVEPVKQIARHVPFSVIETFAFPYESQWMRFGRRRPGRDAPSVALFTLHKVASTFTNDLLSFLNDEYLGLRRMDWDKYVYNKVPQNSSAYIAARTDELFEPSSYCYGVFREALPIEDLDRYKCLLILRDPRDILTSYYFSEAHSHAPPLNPARLREFEERRTYVQSLSIDEYVLERAVHLENKLDAYKQMSRIGRIQPLTYEQMMGDWDGFIEQVAGILNITISNDARAALRARGQIGVEHSGDINSHRRRGTPGDHRDKLKAKTVEQLTDRFGEHLAWLGLEADASPRIEIDLRSVEPEPTPAEHDAAA